MDELDGAQRQSGIELVLVQPLRHIRPQLGGSSLALFRLDMQPDEVGVGLQGFVT